MKLNKKKGFTIVELVIVIAIIGVLAAVLIPTFVRLIRKARINSDTQLIKHLNSALSADAVEHEHNTMTDALNAANDFGFSVDKINVKVSENEIYWDSKNDVFCYYNDGKIEYIPESIDSSKALTADEQYMLWEIVDKAMTDEQIANLTHSVYLASQAAADSFNNKTVHVGVDTGNYTVANLTYENTTSTAKNIVIRTNSFDTALTINAPVDTVKHYDAVGSLNIVAVANASYHENGQVKFVEISKGRIALEKGAEVNHIHINAKVENNVKQDVFEEIIISKEATVEMPDFSRDDVEIATAGTLVVALQAGTEDITTTTELDYVWLTKQGVYEQITVSESKTDAGSTWVNTSDKPAETKTAAQQIANNIGATATVGAVTYDVGVNEDRDIVLKEQGSETVAYTLETQTNGTTELKDGNGDAVDSSVATVESLVTETVEAQPDKEEIKTVTTTFNEGKGTEADPFIIYTSTDFSNITKITKSDKVWYKLGNDITYDVTSIGNYNYVAEMINGDLDLNGKTLSISTNNTNMIIGVGTYAKVHNGTINMNGDIALYDEMNYSLQATLVVDSVDFTGSVTPGGWGPHYGVIDCYAGNTSNNRSIVSTVIINNVNSWVSIKANSTCVGGLLGYCLRANVSITNANVYSYIETGYGAGGIIMSDTQVCGYDKNATAVATGQVWGTVENVKFYGNILVPEGKKGYYFGCYTLSTGTDSDFAGSSATIVKGINIDNDILISSENEFKINSNASYTKYVVRYSFSVDYIDDVAGGYPRVIEKEILNSGEQELATGLYKNNVKEGTFNANTDTYVTDGSNGIFTRTGEDGTYFYDGIGTYKLSKYGVTVTVYAYNGDSLKAVGSYSYPKE